MSQLVKGTIDPLNFFPIYTDGNILDMSYSIMARLHVPVSETMDAREFIYVHDMVQKDVAEEKKAMEKAAAAARRRNR